MPSVITSAGKVYYSLHRAESSAPHPPLFLVHGAGGSMMHWPAELRRLPGHTVLAIDLPGHGRSGGMGFSDVGEYASLVEEVVTRIALPRFVLCGHSLGGAIALEFALRHPQLLAGLILVGTGARLRVAPSLLAGLQTNYEDTIRSLAASAYGTAISREEQRHYVNALRSVPQGVTYGDFLACDRFDCMAEVQSIGLPALVVCGSADLMTPPKYSQHLAEQISGADLLIVTGAGHMVMREQPERVAQAVAGFAGALPVS